MFQSIISKFRWIAFIVATCLVITAIPLFAVVAHVATYNDQFTGFTTSQTTTTQSFTGGNTVIITVITYSGGGADTPNSVKLDNTTSFTSAITNQFFASIGMSIWILPNISGGMHSTTLTWPTGAAYFSIYTTEASGITNSSPVDGAGASNNGNSTTPSCGSYAGTGTDFWWALAQAFTPITAGGTWTIPTNGTESFLGTAVEYKANPGSTPQSGDFNSATGQWAVICTAFKVAAAGGGSRPIVIGSGFFDRK
jgi:hypothetical protein